MSIVVSCKCGKRYRAADELAGKMLTCPSCKAPVQVPEVRSNVCTPQESTPAAVQGEVEIDVVAAAMREELSNPQPEPPLAVPIAQSSYPWGFWATIGFSLVVFVVLVVVQGVVAVAFMLAGHYDVSAASSEELVAFLERDGLLLSVATIVSGPCCVGLIVLFAWLRRGHALREYLGLHWPSSRRVAAWLAVTTGFIVASDTLTWLLGRPIVPEFMTDVYDTARIPVLLYLALIGVAPIFEELFFRGFMIAGLRRSPLGAVGAVLLTSVAWALLHMQYDAYQIMTLVVGGILLGTARLTTGSTYLPILLHVFMNTVATTELLVKVYSLS